MTRGFARAEAGRRTAGLTVFTMTTTGRDFASVAGTLVDWVAGRPPAAIAPMSPTVAAALAPAAMILVASAGRDRPTLPGSVVFTAPVLRVPRFGAVLGFLLAWVIAVFHLGGVSVVVRRRRHVDDLNRCVFPFPIR